MNKDNLIALAVLTLAIFFAMVGALYVDRFADNEAPLGNSLALGECDVYETVVAVGHQAATQLLPVNPARQWAIVQQPLNATNTLALSLDGSAAVGSGYELPPASVISGTATSTPEFRFGYATDIRTGNALSARTNNGSTTAKVLECR